MKSHWHFGFRMYADVMAVKGFWLDKKNRIVDVRLDEMRYPRISAMAGLVLLFLLHIDDQRSRLFSWL